MRFGFLPLVPEEVAVATPLFMVSMKMKLLLPQEVGIECRSVKPGGGGNQVGAVRRRYRPTTIPQHNRRNEEQENRILDWEEE
jgi:hypothetical protein